MEAWSLMKDVSVVLYRPIRSSSDRVSLSIKAELMISSRKRSKLMHFRALFNKLTPVFHASVLLLIEFRHNIVKEAVDPRGDSRVDPQTTLTMLGRNSLSITGQTH